MKIKEVIQFLETKYPLAWQEDFDNCGLQCGNAEQEIKGVLVCFEMSDYTIEEALKKSELFCKNSNIYFDKSIDKTGI